MDQSVFSVVNKTSAKNGKPRKRIKINPRLLALQIIIVAVVIIYFFPVYIIITTSFKSMADYFASPLGLPETFYFDNYVQAWKTSKMYISFLNSFLITSVSVLFIVVFGSMAAYPLARTNSRVSKLLYVFFVAGIMLPFQTGMIPLVKMVKDLGLINTYTGIICVYIATNMPFSVFLYSSFLKSVPNDIEEAALIDGCNRFQLFWRILFPLVTPATSTVVIFTSLGIWNDFMLPLLLINGDSKRTVPQAVYVFFGKYAVNWGPAFAVLVMSMIPIVILFLALQKNYVKGIVAGSVKG